MIRLLVAEDLPSFEEHLNTHYRESGNAGDAVFMPRPGPSSIENSDSRKNAWRVDVGTPGWGRSWGCFEGDSIIGHIELGYSGPLDGAHRCVLGMGVSRSHRTMGHGGKLLSTALNWAKSQTQLSWIDLGVFSDNHGALQLYYDAGFRSHGFQRDLFRIEKLRIDNILMSMKVEDDSPPEAAPTLLSKRLSLSSLRIDDAQALADYHSRNREHLRRWSPDRGERLETSEYWAAVIAKSLSESNANSSFTFAIRHRSGLSSPDRTIIGLCSLSAIKRGYFDACYLGFSIDSTVQGQGYMSEGLKEVIAFAFDELRLHRIMANYIDNNSRSASVLGRLGFEIEGRGQDYLRIAGEWQNHTLTSLVNK